MTDKRKQRHRVGWLLVIFLSCDLALLFFMLFYWLGLYNSRFLTAAFEESGYYGEQETLMGEQFASLLTDAGLSELLEFDSYRDAFERMMRNQVYGRQGEIPELTAASIAERISERLDGMGLEERSILTEGGILLLADDLDTLFQERGQISELSSFWETERILDRTVQPLLIALLLVFLVGNGFLFFLQKRRRKYLMLLGVSLIIGSLIYLLTAGLLAGCLFGLLGTPGAGLPSALFLGSEAVMEQYRIPVLTVGAVIGVAGFAGAIFALLSGRRLWSEK